MKRVALLALIFVVGCGSPSGLKFRDGPAPKKADSLKTKQFDRNTSFGLMMEDVIKPKCLSCHNSDKKSGKTDLSSYESIMSKEGLVKPGSPNDSVLFLILVDNDMPQRPNEPLTTTQKDIVHKWIASGAKEKDETQEEESVDPESSYPQGIANPFQTEPTDSKTSNEPKDSQAKELGEFDAQVKGLLEKNCVGCHGDKRQASGLDFTSYEKIMAKGLVKPGSPDDSKLWTVVRKGIMPPSNPLQEEIQQKLFTWILEGAKN